MTTYNTGNPIGSTDVRDLYDNAQVFDEAVNSAEPTYTDRRGVVRPTLVSGIDPTGIAQSAVNAKVAAEAARDAAQLSSGIYASTAAGLAATTSGRYFSVPSSLSNEYLILYLNSSGSAVEVKRYPSASAADNTGGIGRGKNQFDPSLVVPGYEVYGDATIALETNSSISGFIYVKGQNWISISGLQANAGSNRYYRFMAEDRTTVVSNGSFSGNSTLLVVPSGAYWLQFSPKQRNAAAADYSTAQVEYGPAITEFEAFQKRQVLYVGNNPIYVPTLDIITKGAGKNQFDSSQLVDSVEVDGSGNLAYRTQNDCATTGFIYVKGQSSLAISGLQSNTMNARFYVFLAADKTTKISYGNIGTGTSATLAVPSNAVWFQLSVKQRNVAATNVSTVQIQYGSVVTPYEAFSRRVLNINDLPVTQDPVFTLGGQKNKFDRYSVTEGYEVYGDGSIAVESSSAVSDFINVRFQAYVTLSGLQSNTGFANRYYVFYAEDKTTVVGTGYVTGTSATISVPAGAAWFRFSPRQRTTDPANYSTTQVEYGQTATTYAAYVPRILKINGVDVEKTYADPATSGAWSGKRFLTFGDSITETGDADAGNFGTGIRSNWPLFAQTMLQMSSLRNYARSGASFREYYGQLTWQKISHQISTAQANGETPDVIVISCGTNDGTGFLSDYTAAMGKATLNDLNMGTTTEAMRWAFWSIQTAWPNAKKFAVLPIQRADAETADRQPLLDMISKLAKRYGFTVIDAHSESGIVKDFEVWNAAGRDLYDGLHPSVSGQTKMADLIASRIKSSILN